MQGIDFDYRLLLAGHLRSYHLHLPPSYEKSISYPLMFALHGRLGTGSQLRRQTGFDRIADREGVIIVYPDGVKRSWADGRGVTVADRLCVDDLTFLEILMERLLGAFSVDPARIFITGYSNGGTMGLRFVLEKKPPVRGIAVVSSSPPNFCFHRPFRESLPSLMVVHGSGDTIVPYKGALSENGFKALAVEDFVRAWIKAAHCLEPPRIERIFDLEKKSWTTVYSYGSEEKGCRVKVYRIEGGGHVWPEEDGKNRAIGAGRVPREINATEEIWSFFKRM